MTEFKVGDRVERIQSSYNGMGVGDQGTITEVKRGSVIEIKEYPGRGMHDANMFKLVEENNMTEFKVGDKVRVSLSGDYPHQRDQMGVSTVVRVSDGYSRLNVQIQNKEGSTNSYAHSDLEKAEKFSVGDELISHRSYNLLVIGVAEQDGTVYYTTLDTDDQTARVFREESLNGCTVKQEEEVKEVTLSEIADKFGIDVSKVRIKE